MKVRIIKAASDGDTKKMALNDIQVTLLAERPDVSQVATAKAKLAGVMGKEEEKKLEEISAGDQFIDGLDIVLTQRVVERTAAIGKSQKETEFHSLRPPSISIKHYLRRIQHFFVCSPECFVLALVYINRAGKMDSLMQACDLNVHRLLFFAMIVATKSHDDEYYKNSYYAKVGGMPLAEVNALEVKFLKTLDWNTFVTLEEYQLHHNILCPVKTSRGGEPEPEP